MTNKQLLAAIILAVTIGGFTSVVAQNETSKNYLELPWKRVATEMPDEWYGSNEAKATAELVLLNQRWSGGWNKNTAFHKPITRGDSSALVENKRLINDATFDNDATTTEIRFLAKVYNKTKIDRYKEAFEDGILFIFQSQYPNGGWPQVYPLKPGYYSHITINDNAMANNMRLLKDIFSKNPEFAFVDNFFVERSKKVFDRGVDCILKMQIVRNGKPTVWCSQHDEYNFDPAMGRTYELPSFSGSESVSVIRILMGLEFPSPEVINAVDGAIDWYKAHKLSGIRVETFTNADGKRDRRVVSDPAAPAIWGRFYDLNTEKPIFSDRDGIKKNSLAEIHIERRSGYGWYTSEPQEVIDAYPAWAARWKNTPSVGRSWKAVATDMAADWYGSKESKEVAENVLLYQRKSGGWPKNIAMHQPLTSEEKAELKADKPGMESTLDNDATTTEMKFMAKMYAATKDMRYRKSFERALDYLLAAQYANGGWPQFFPIRQGYYTHITYNDDAMVNIMNLMKQIFTKQPQYSFVATPTNIKKAQTAYDKGVECMLNTQIIVDGKHTVWCAQHDETTLAPTKARAYELPSFSGSESVGIVLLLMDIEKPSQEIIDAIQGAVKWFESHKVTGIKMGSETDSEGRRNRIVVQDPTAPAMWGRFYDLETELPFFSDRDGIKKATLAEIGHERRNGYSWYTTAPQTVLDAYPAWAKRVGVK